ncbi:TonB-dependent receptor [Luteimonas suaedae]|uniref:TonB-dependent receptor n=1 Tax=Luteimonas suaedae TaxID=2605430 RepID=UPI002106A72F|nr:TonB-dependent receptor [Luteimonas suaedae]
MNAIQDGSADVARSEIGLSPEADGFRLTLARGALSAALTSLLPLHAATAQEKVPIGAVHAFDLPAGDLGLALDAFGAQSGIRPEYPPGLVDGKRAQAVHGQMSWREALDRLLLGSGLAYGYSDGKVVITGRTGKTAGPVSPSVPADPERAAPQAEPEATDLAAITVTGTRIRGGTTPSPVITIGAERIQEEGFTDLGEVIRSVPQNFSGGQNPGIVAGAEGGGIANQNTSGGSALNLRGLGPDATLTLLNGRRLAYSGFVQAVDIGAIPVAAIDRLEIIPDGASAIYGSDAVGGVGNVILKRDHEGVSVGARYGSATDGGLATREYDMTAGAPWRGGGLIATWKRSIGEQIDARQRDYTRHLDGPTSLLPESGLRSGLVSAHHLLFDGVELRLDALRTKRNQVVYYPATADSYFPATAATTTAFASPGLQLSLPSGWTSSTGVTWGEDETLTGLSIVSRSTGAVTPLAPSSYRNRTVSYEAEAEGSLFAMPGGHARLAVGAGHRENTFVQENLATGAIGAAGSESSRFVYAEINLPVVGAGPQMPSVPRFTVTAALRGEDYDSFGEVVTPKVGVVYRAGTDLTLKASWGKSFKAPTLLQRYQTPSAYLYTATALGGTGFPAGATVLVPYGGNPDLEPERARTWSATAAFHPVSLPGLEVEASWFDIDFSDRIAQPLVYQAEALSNPRYAAFIDHGPTAEALASVLAMSQFSNFTGEPYDPGQVVAIAFNRYINTVSQRVRGLDLSGSYRVDLGESRLQLRGSASWLRSAQQRLAGEPFHDLSGTLFHPARLNGRTGAVWSQGGFSASVFANYVGGVTNPVDDRKTASFTTVDASLRYDTADGDGPWSGLDIALSAMNAFDRQPPLYAPLSVGNPPYDSTNYSPVGRFLSVSVAKRW